MVKRSVGAGRVFLGAAGGGVAEAVAVGALGVAVGLNRLFDLETFREEEEAREELSTWSGSMEIITELFCLDNLRCRSLLRYLAALIEIAFAFSIHCLSQG